MSVGTRHCTRLPLRERRASLANYSWLARTRTLKTTTVTRRKMLRVCVSMVPFGSHVSGGESGIDDYS
jgi:hypothetical protein